MNIQSPVKLDRTLAVSLAEGVVTTLDQKPLRPYIDAMMTEGYEFALAISAISGDAPDDFGLFLAMCEKQGFFTDDESFAFLVKQDDAEDAAAAA